MSAAIPWRDRDFLVLGVGAFGGGAGCARALAKAGARVTATDLRGAADLGEALALLKETPVRLELGGHREEMFRPGRVVVVNPAVHEDSPWIELARRRGCRLTTDVNLALERAAEVPAFAVTGTHGKSTCAALAAHLLQGAFPRVVLAGNLGGSLLEAVAGLTPRDRLVVELSSYQLARLEAPRPWPQVAALTCLGSDHLDWHGSPEAYARAKRRLPAGQGEDGLQLLPLEDPEAAAWAAAGPARSLWLAPRALPADREGWEVGAGVLRERRGGRLRELAPAGAFPFPEPYRLPSLLAAVGAARLLGLPPGAVADRLRSFPGLPHRMERLPAPPGNRILDNGVATHPEPTRAALQAPRTPVILVAGGKDKNLPLEGLAGALASCRQAHLFGAGGRRLARLAPRQTAVFEHPGTREAVQAALSTLQQGETLLFSPSFSSYDEFRNFRDRARLFQEICAAWAARRETPARDRSRSAY